MAKAKSRGGKRKGAGAKRSALPRELMDRLGPPPLGQPLKLARWFTDAIAMLTQLVMEGQPYASMLETVRASAGAAGRVLPHDIIYEANKRLRDDEKDLAQTTNGARVIAREDDHVTWSAGASRRGPARG